MELQELTGRWDICLIWKKDFIESSPLIFLAFLTFASTFKLSALRFVKDYRSAVDRFLCLITDILSNQMSVDFFL
jgi:hypothetical protein